MNESGYITVAVKTAGGALPVENAVVTVRDENDNILYAVFTDRSGKTARLTVPAPPKANSGTPNTNLPPFYKYTVDTDKQGFVSVRNLNVPVYPGINSIQPVELLPLPEGVTSPSVNFNESGAPQL